MKILTLPDWGCSSVGRAPPLHGGGQGFESPHLHLGSIAMLLMAIRE